MMVNMVLWHLIILYVRRVTAQLIFRLPRLLQVLVFFFLKFTNILAVQYAVYSFC